MIADLKPGDERLSHGLTAAFSIDTVFAIQMDYMEENMSGEQPC